MTELVFIKKDDVFTTTMIVAGGTGIEHESVVAHLKKYPEDFAELGPVEFTDFKSGKRGRPKRIYNLNEMQASLLITYLDNGEIVRMFKKELIKQFYAMKHLLMEKHTADWQQARIASKSARLQETDAIKLLVDYARNQGSQNADKLYVAYGKLVKGLAGYDTLDMSTTETLETVMFILKVIRGVIFQEMAENTHYKEIYQRAKRQLVQLANLLTTPRISA